MARERDARNAIQAALLASGQFSDVWLTGLPEDYGHGASDLTAAAIEPGHTRFARGWDSLPGAGADFTAQLLVTVLARNHDPQLRDELAEQLVDVVANAINGQRLGNLSLPQKTMVTGWKWLPAVAPERRIAITVTFDYLATWSGFDTSP